MLQHSATCPDVRDVLQHFSNHINGTITTLKCRPYIRVSIQFCVCGGFRSHSQARPLEHVLISACTRAACDGRAAEEARQVANVSVEIAFRDT